MQKKIDGRTREARLLKIGEHPSASLLGIEPDKIKAFTLDIFNNGFTTVKQLHEKYGATDTTALIALLYRSHRVFREVMRPTDQGEMKGYEWADRRFSKAEIAKLPPALGFISELTRKSVPRYADFEEIEVKCRWTNQVLGGVPMKDSNGQDFNGFERGLDKEIVIPAYCLRAMTRHALPLIGKEQSISYRIAYESVRVRDVETSILQRGVVREGQGLGMRRNEAIPAGTTFIIRAMIPTTAITQVDFLRLLSIAGRKVRFSPASSSGYGDFEVLS